MTVRLGNPQPRDVETGKLLPGPATTTVQPPDGHPLEELLADIRALWPRHSAAPTPTWVTSDDPYTSAYLAAQLGCPTREDAC